MKPTGQVKVSKTYFLSTRQNLQRRLKTICPLPTLVINRRMTFGRFKTTLAFVVLVAGVAADTPPTVLAAGSTLLKIVKQGNPDINTANFSSVEVASKRTQDSSSMQSSIKGSKSQIGTEAGQQPTLTSPLIVLSTDPSKGLISSIKKTYVLDPPTASAVFTDFEYKDKGNIRHITNKRFYYQKVVVSEEDIIRKIDPSLPESSDLEPSKDIAPAYTSVIASPYSFDNWDGVATAIVEELNLVRTHPQQYAAYVDQQLATFLDDKTYQQGMYITRSVEGKKAWREASQFLKSQPPVGALRRVACLDRSAMLMVSDAVENNIIGYVDTKNRTPFERMKETCLINEGSESIAYGFMSARLAVIQLLVDDSVEDRNHRLTLFKNFTQVGIAARAFPPDFASIVIIDLLY